MKRSGRQRNTDPIIAGVLMARIGLIAVATEDGESGMILVGTALIVADRQQLRHV